MNCKLAASAKNGGLTSGLVILVIVGALLWARGRDPFQRIWFTVKTPAHGKAKCVAVLPKTAARPLPVVVYLHGAGGSLLGSGNNLRQMAEMGLAAVGMEYCQTNDVVFEQQFSALLRHLHRQRWADTNAVAWVGFSLGAEKTLRFALNHPKMQPQLLIRLAGGWIPELEQFEVQRPALVSCPVLLVHGDQDGVFPVAVAQRVAGALRTNGVSVELRILRGQGHGLEPNRGAIFRGLGEYCLTHLRGPGALGQYRSIAMWQSAAKPLWVYRIPAIVWACGWVVLKWRARRARLREATAKPACWEIGLRWLAVVLVTLALAQTGLHLVLPRVRVSETTLAIARKFLVQRKMIADFEYLAANPLWKEQRLKILLEHAALANYNRGLVNWKLDDEVYREFVLSPMIRPGSQEELHWRRPLWESFYPRIRKEQSLEAAAEIVVRHLRERVTIADGENLPAGAASIWNRQITNPFGFEDIYVAALRSAGIPARLNSQKRAEYWTGAVWCVAPPPPLQDFP